MKITYLVLILNVSLSLAATTHWISKTTVPQELRGAEGLVSERTGLSRSFSVVTDGLELKVNSGGLTSVKLPNSRQIMAAGVPRLPFQVSQFEVPRGYRANVQLSNVTWEETEGNVHPVSNPTEIYEWSPVPKLNFAPSSNKSNRFFPGQLFSAQQEGNRLLVTVFPVQWDSNQQKLLRMSGGRVSVAWEFDSRLLAWSGLGGVSSLIVTSQKMQGSAALLREFHAARFGVRSQIVTVEELRSSEEMVSEDQLPDGYKNSNQKDAFVVPYNPETGAGYHYDLARKIIGFLHKSIVRGSVRYVTILGTSALVPPSYYYAADNGSGGALFTPTDRCYGAVDKCLDGKAAVGRLPFSSEAEMTNYLSKVSMWLERRSETELSLFGGHAFPRADVYIGELGTLITVNSDTSDWRSVKKFFQSRKNFTKETVLDLVSGKTDSSLSYYLDHGNGNQWFVDVQTNKYVSSNDVLATEKAANSIPPVVASIACTNGAFDDEVTKEPILTSSDKLGSVSVGVALLRSKAGSVVYVGSARPALGQPIYTVDNSGNVEVTGSNYGLQLLDNMVEKYRSARQGRMGDFFLRASQAYVSELGNDMKESQNLWSYYLAVYLGDPLLPMPQRTESTPVSSMAKSLAALENAMGFGVPVLRKEALKEFLFPVESSGPATAKLYKVDVDWNGYVGETELATVALDNGKSNIPVNLEGDASVGQYMVRVENTVGAPRERTVVFRVE